MAALDDLAATLFGGRRAETNSVLTDGTTHTYVGTATSDSQDGHVMVELSGDVTNPDPVEIDGEVYYSDADTSVELPTTASVQEGDEVLVSVYGGTPLRSPVVTGVVGSGDRVAGMASEAWTKADSVEGIAQQALDVANATGQHFWSDTDGAHVTEVTQEEWTDPTDPSYQSGPNSLWNSLGMLFRDGLTNLLAVLTSGISIYDGLGNTKDHILAEFSPAKVRLGGNVDNGIASVEFFDTTGVENVLKSEIDVSNHVVNTELQLSSTTTDEALDVSGEVHAFGNVRVSQYANNDGTTPYGGSSAELFASAYDSLADDTKKAWVSAGANSDGGGEGSSRISLYAETLYLNNFLRGEEYTMEQVICALQRPMATWTGTSGTVTDGAGWHQTDFNTLLAEHGPWSDYFTLSGGRITALKDVTLQLTMDLSWNDNILGIRGAGFFKNSAVGSGVNEISSFSAKGANNRFYCVFPPRLITLGVGEYLNIGRYNQLANSIFTRGTNYTWLTVEVVG